MIYIYDNAITEDLLDSFNPERVPDPVVKVVDPESAIDLVAQIQNDEVSFPIVALFRDQNIHISQERTNFTRLHSGVAAGFDNESNNFYKERSIPIDLNYTLTVLTTRMADLDEIIRELLFKYSTMYFIDVVLPYEVPRKTRFGIQIVPGTDINYSSTTNSYNKAGKLYQAEIPLVCDGTVLVSYTEQKLQRAVTELGEDFIVEKKTLIPIEFPEFDGIFYPIIVRRPWSYPQPTPPTPTPGDCKVLYGSTAHWNHQSGLIAQEGYLYVYRDRDVDEQGRIVAGIKAGDGKSYLIDMPFIDQISTDHINNVVVHITDLERAFWNNKVRCYVEDPYEIRDNNLIFTTK